MLNNWRQILSNKEIDYPKDHKPFTKSSKGFSCKVCEYFHEIGENEYECSSEYYQKWKGSNKLEIDDPEKWCSDWFEEKEEYLGHSLDPSGGEDSDDGW